MELAPELHTGQSAVRDPIPEQRETSEQSPAVRSVIKTPYDSSISYLYKWAVFLNVPVRFVIIEPETGRMSFFVEVFDLDDHPNAKFITIFDYIRRRVLAGPPTLNELWNEISQFQGDAFNPSELVPILLHAMPEYREAGEALYPTVATFLSSIGEQSIYPNMKGFIDYYNSVWLPRFISDLESDRQTVEKFTRVQDQISQIAPLYHSQIKLDSVTVTYDLSFPNNPLPDIFNTAYTSYIIPYIQYNSDPAKSRDTDGSDRFYKIYKGRSVDAQPNYNNITLPPTVTSRGFTIYLSIWSGPNMDTEEETQEDARTGKKEGFMVASINYLPESKVIRVTVNAPFTEEINQNVMIDRLHQHISALPKPPEKAINENRISGNFTIYNADVIEESFLHLIMNDPLFSSYLYLEEAQKSFAVKQRLIIHYRGAIADKANSDAEGGRNRAAVSATINQDRIPRGETVLINTETGQLARYAVNQPEGLSVIQIKMTKASSRRVAEQFVNIISRLFRVYLEKGQSVVDEYIRFIPEYQMIINQKLAENQAPQETIPATIQNGQIMDSTNESRIRRLQKYAEDVFVVNYARQCQKPLQPIPVRLEEIPFWQRKVFVNKNTGLLEERQILPFPPDNPRYYFVCPYDKNPYPGVKPNNNLSNKHIYPYTPCCFGTNQFTKNTSNWHLYVSGQAPVVKKTKNDHEISTDKFLSPERIGFVSSTVANFLSKYSDEPGEIRRYGVPRDPNSFIHCVALAVRDPGYMNSPDKAAYVSLLRSRLFYQNRENPGLGIYPELLRQEFYDMANEDIIRHIGDENEFFDPLTCYRVMEVLFNCTIYVFALNDKDRKTGQVMSLLQLPRHQYFHAHPPSSGTRTVLIVRHWGSEVNSSEYPQCELIVDKRQNEIRMLFDEDMNEILYPAMAFVGRTITWQIMDSANQRPTLTARQNVYSALNYQKIFGQILVNGQIIDDAGKARMFSLHPQWSSPEHKGYSPLEIYVNVPPTAPLNVPTFRAEDISKNLPPYERTIELFGNPVSATVGIDGTRLTGLWFSAGDLQFAFYCPCADIPMSEFKEKYPNVGTPGTELSALTISIPRESNLILGSSLDRIREFRRSSAFITQIVRYLYLIAGRPESIDGFLATIAGMLDQNNKPDSALIYGMTSLQRILPDPDLGVEGVLTALSAQVPRVFPGGRLLIYDQQMYTGIRYGLIKWSKEVEGLPVDILDYRELKAYYTSKHDYQTSPREWILSSLQEYNSWISVYVPSPNLQQRQIQNLKDNIQTQLNPNAYSYQEPYIYQKSGNTTIGTSLDPRQDLFYLIQNVAGGEFRRAIQVAYTWYLEKRNTGFGTEVWNPDNPNVPVYRVYRISQGGGTIVETSASSDASSFLEILHYGGNLYAAMLPIL